MRVLFTTVALSGHFFPLVPLAWAFRLLGHEVLVAAPEEFASSVTQAGLPTASTGDAGPVELAAAPLAGETSAERRLANGRTFGRIAAGSLEETTRVVRSWRPDLVVSERAEFAGPIAAAVHGIMHVELRWGVAPLSEYRTAAARELRPMLTRRGLTTLPEPFALLSPWPPSLRIGPPGQLTLRHVSYNGAARVPGWLWEGRERPRVAITLGTVVPDIEPDWAPRTVLPLVEALAVEGFEAVVLVDDKLAASWPELPPAVRHVGRMPLLQTLEAADVLVHHGGQGTSLTAFEAGRPQLVLPVFDDQFDNAEAVVRSGAGRQLAHGEASPDAVARACSGLITRPGFAAAAARVAAEIRAQPDPVEVALELARLAGGSAGATRAA